MDVRTGHILAFVVPVAHRHLHIESKYWYSVFLVYRKWPYLNNVDAEAVAALWKNLHKTVGDARDVIRIAG